MKKSLFQLHSMFMLFLTSSKGQYEQIPKIYHSSANPAFVDVTYGGKAAESLTFPFQDHKVWTIAYVKQDGENYAVVLKLFLVKDEPLHNIIFPVFMNESGHPAAPALQSGVMLGDHIYLGVVDQNKPYEFNPSELLIYQQHSNTTTYISLLKAAFLNIIVINSFEIGEEISSLDPTPYGDWDYSRRPVWLDNKINIAINFPSWTINPLPTYKGFIGPADLCLDQVGMKYKDAQINVNLFLQSQDVAHLDDLCAVLYRKPRFPRLKTKAQYKEEDVAKRVRKIAKWPFVVKYGIFLNFIAFPYHLKNSPFTIDGEEVTFSILFSDEPSENNSVKLGPASKP